MPTAAGGIYIDPNGSSAVVQVTTPTGVAIPMFSDVNCANSVVMPATITVRTAFYSQNPEPAASVSVKVGGTEYASPGNKVFQTSFQFGAMDGITLPDPSVLISAPTGTYVQVKDERLHYTESRIGGVGDGVTNNDAAWTAAMGLLATNGGELWIPPGKYVHNSQLTGLPVDASTPPNLKSVKVIGAGASHNGRNGVPLGGTIMLLRAAVAGGDGKITSRGVGHLSIERMTLQDDTDGTTPFIYSTNTTLFVDDVEFYGKTGGQTCVQDAIILGGTGTVADGSAAAPFQGYGTVVQRNYFNNIRRGVYGRTYANGVVVRDNTWWQSCGSGDTTPAIDFLGIASNATVGGFISGNLIEMVNYKYGVRLGQYTNTFSLGPNGFYDATAYTLAYYRCEVGSQYNLVMAGAGADTYPMLSDADGSTTLITSHQALPTYWPQGIGIGPSANANSKLIDNGNGRIRTPGRIEQMTGLAVGAHPAATTPGAVTNKVPMYDENGNLLGYIPVYATIA